MSGTGGWYPDPSGVRGRYRYWDGDAWSDETTTDPTHAAPPVKAGTGDRDSSNNKAWLVALAVLALITAIVVALLLRGTGSPFGGGQAKEDTNSAKPTISAWDETSTPTTPPPPDLTGGVWIDCPVSTGVGNTHQTAGRLTAAGLSMKIPAGYGSQNDYVSMVYDQHAVGRSIPNGFGFWSAISVGLASNADGFVDLATTANQLMQCNSMTNHYVDMPPTVLIAGESMTISGHSAWHVRWHIHYNSNRPIPGEILDSIAVDMGPDAGYIAVYWSCRPQDNADFEASITAAIDSLEVA